jgi:hypothetical protein
MGAGAMIKDSSGNLLIVVKGASVVKKYNSTGIKGNTLTLTASGGYMGDFLVDSTGGMVFASLLGFIHFQSGPAGVAITSNGVLAVSCSWNQIRFYNLVDGTPLGAVTVNSAPGKRTGSLANMIGVEELSADLQLVGKTLITTDYRDQVILHYAENGTLLNFIGNSWHCSI